MEPMSVILFEYVNHRGDRSSGSVSYITVGKPGPMDVFISGKQDGIAGPCVR